MHEHIMHEPIMHEPIMQEPIMHEHIMHEPIMQEPIMQDTQLNTKTKDSQNFKSKIPINLLWDYLQTNFIDKDTHFSISKFLYKKTEYNNSIIIFIDSLKEYYYVSKRKYIEGQMNYKKFLTIIRQICNANNINYTTKLVYDKSSYEIEYSIYK
jgi:hypothetical protein